MKTLRTIYAAGAALAILAGVATASLAEPLDTPAGDPLLARMASVENLQQICPWLLGGGQPDSAALAALAETGRWDVFDLRAKDEPRGIDEKRLARSLGLRYRPIPTRPDDFNDAYFTAFRHHLIEHGPEHPLFIHCHTGNRVGATLLPWLVLDQGMDETAAFDVARKLGLSDPEITRRAVDYIRARQSQSSRVR